MIVGFPDVIVTLIFGAYTFTAAVTAAGAWGFFYLYRLITNHIDHRLKRIEDELGL